MPRPVQLSVTGVFLLLMPLAAWAGETRIPNDKELWNEASARIQRHRKADVVIKVVDHQGRPVPQARVHMQQTRHAFLFGCNIFNWDGISDPSLQAQYRDRFSELLNFATLPFWDVVNEPTHVDRDQFVRRAPKLTRMWMDKGQIEFTKRCFERARKAGPDATLLINDYRVDRAYADVIEQLVESDGTPLYDVIGIQSHQHAGTWTNRKIWEVCQRFARFGVPLHFTETTILSGELGWRSDDQREPWPSTEAGEAYQAREVERFYTMLYSHPAVEAITWWDFSDARAWKRAPAGLLRSDMTPKAAYATLLRLVRQKWWTDERITTNSAGRASCRATYGDYQLTVAATGHEPITISATVSRGDRPTIQVQLP